jgi:hypothetical protein
VNLNASAKRSREQAAAETAVAESAGPAALALATHLAFGALRYPRLARAVAVAG